MRTVLRGWDFRLNPRTSIVSVPSVCYCPTQAFLNNTMSQSPKAFNEYRSKMNELILSKNNKVINRLFNLDTNTYAEGALPTRIKEMLGLVASMVLRCDDCIKYHLGKCREVGISTDELYEIFAVANIVGGTIVIPHTRRAAEYWEELMGGE
jgi:AhpD family alkylhydroperoxidase